jgi:hypothetical protein
MDAQDHDTNLGIALDDLCRRIDAVQMRHCYVHNCDIRRQALSESHCFHPVRGFSDYFHAGLPFQNRSEAFSHHQMVIRQ